MPSVKRKTPAHVMTASLLIGTMASGLAIVLDSAGFWSEWDLALNGWMDRLGEGMREVSRESLLCCVVFASYLLPFLLLRTPQWWRRMILWLSFLLVSLAWWPVLALASWKMEPCMPMAALVWSGFCAMVYAQRHLLPCENAAAARENVATGSSVPAVPTEVIES